MRRAPARLVTWIMFVFLALVFTTGSSLVWERMDTWSGLPKSSTLITQCCVVCFSGSALILLQLWSFEPPRARALIRHTLWAIAAALAAMVVLFLRSDAVHQHQNSFTGWYGGSVEYDLYLLTYLAVFTTTLVAIAYLCWRYARWSAGRWLRTGLATACLGAAIAMIYAVSRLADMLAAHLGADLSRWENLAESGAGIGAILIIIGLTTPTWGPRASAAVTWARHVRDYQHLRPLWVALHAFDPGIALETPLAGAKRWWTAARHPTEVDYRLARRVVEIRDGILALHPFLDPHTATHAREHHRQRGLHGEELDAAVEAWRIRAALEVAGTAAGQPATPQPSAMNNTPADLEAEIAWLLMVAAAFTRTDTPPSPQGAIP